MSDIYNWIDQQITQDNLPILALLAVGVGIILGYLGIKKR